MNKSELWQVMNQIVKGGWYFFEDNCQLRYGRHRFIIRLLHSNSNLNDGFYHVSFNEAVKLVKHSFTDNKQLSINYLNKI